MANRLVRNMVMLAKLESTYGVDPVPTGADNAMLISNVNVNPLNAQNVDRDLIRSYLGGSEQLVGTKYAEVGFDLELQASGTLGVAPAWGPVLIACGFAETVTAVERVDYTLVTDAIQSLTAYLYDSGVLHKFTGARGTWELAGVVGERPVLRFNFIGLYEDIEVAANATPVFTDWKVPKIVTDQNSGDLTFGCTYAAGALTGGTPYPSRGITITSGNEVNFNALLGGETVDLDQRQIGGDFALDLTPAQEVTFMGNVINNTLQTLGWVHGTEEGLKVLLFTPGLQILNPSKSSINGKRLIGYDFRMVPVAGNDELRIVCI